MSTHGQSNSYDDLWDTPPPPARPDGGFLPPPPPQYLRPPSPEFDSSTQYATSPPAVPTADVGAVSVPGSDVDDVYASRVSDANIYEDVSVVSAGYEDGNPAAKKLFVVVAGIAVLLMCIAVLTVVL